MMTRIIEAWNFRPVIRVFVYTLFLFSGSVSAQQNFDDTDLLPASFHAQRRSALKDSMPKGTCAVFFANPVRNRTNDVDFQYVQDPDFYYLTGYTEPNSVLLIFSEPVEWEGSPTDEILFIQPRNPESEMWNGKRAGVDYVKQVLGIQSVALNYEFDGKVPSLKSCSQVWVKWPVDIGGSFGKKTSLH